MTNLYSHNQHWPQELPFRIKLADGSTRTDPSTFTAKELTAWGYTGPYTEPEFDCLTNALEWSGDSFVIRDLTEAELDAILDEKKQQVRSHRNSLLSSSDWTQLNDAPVDASAWAAYRQQLRDITTQEGFPSEVVWPATPQLF